MYDIFYIAKEKDENYQILQKHFPFLKLAKFDNDSSEALENARKRTLTNFFWIIDNNFQVENNFLLDYKVTEWDKEYVHIFKQKNGAYGGIYLIPKEYNITSKQAEHKFFVNRKEVDIVAGSYIPYEKYIIKTPEDYFDALKNCRTEMFYAIQENFIVEDNFDFDYPISEFDKKYVHVFKQKNGAYGGIYLIPKSYSITKKEAEHNFFVNKKDVDLVVGSFPPYEQYIIKNSQDYFDAIKNCKTEMFYAISHNFIVEDFDFDYPVAEYDKKYVHVFRQKNGAYGGLSLIPKLYPMTKKEAEHNFFVNKKEIDLVVGSYIPYEKFIINKPEDYFDAIKNCKTEMFYAISHNFIVEDFDFDYPVAEYDKKYLHVFRQKNGAYGGVYLIPKSYPITKKEAEHNFFVNKKEVDLIVGSYIPYEKYIINKPEDYFDALKNCKTSMFYAIEESFVIENFDFDYPVAEYDKKYVHVFKQKNGTYGGLYLISKEYPMTKKEAEYNFFVNKKEVDLVVGAFPPYERFIINAPEDYFDALKNCKTSMFYAISIDYKPLDDFDFDYPVPEYDKKYVHVFKEKSGTYNGIYIIPKDYPMTKKEAEYNFFVNRKEIDIVASEINYDKFVIDSSESYYKAQEQSKTSMFYATDVDFKIENNFTFDYFVSDYDKQYVHIFKTSEEKYEGVYLIPKKYSMTDKETQFGFFLNRKNLDIVASYLCFDIVFISYNEPNADENYAKLKERFPYAKRVHGIKGIHNAHIEAAKLAQTSMFWVVDGDAIIVDDFNFDMNVPKWDRTVVHVFRSQNPINDLVYGYGGVKLLPRELTLNMNKDTVDMTTSISKKFKSIEIVSNITGFNTDPFSTWKSAFRECVKLSSKVIDGQIDEQTQERLDIWCSIGKDREYGEYAINGAIKGKEFGLKYANDPEMLKKINDFEWLENEFRQ